MQGAAACSAYLGGAANPPPLCAALHRVISLLQVWQLWAQCSVSSSLLRASSSRHHTPYLLCCAVLRCLLECLVPAAGVAASASWEHAKSLPRLRLTWTHSEHVKHPLAQTSLKRTQSDSAAALSVPGGYLSDCGIVSEHQRSLHCTSGCVPMHGRSSPQAPPAWPCTSAGACALW